MFIAVFLALMRLRGTERRFALVLLATIAVAMLPLSWDDRKTVWFVLAALIGLARAPTMVWRPAEPSPQYAGAPLYRGPTPGRPGPIAVPQARRGTSR